MTGAAAVNASGAVTVGSVTFLVKELTIEAELGLRAKLRSLARDAFGPGSFYANIQPAAQWARDKGHHQDAAVLVANVAPLIATKVGASDDATEVYRQSPDGVAWELYFRTRHSQPDATRDEIRATLNEVNCLEVHLAILEAIAPKAPIPNGSPSG